VGGGIPIRRSSVEIICSYICNGGMEAEPQWGSGAGPLVRGQRDEAPEAESYFCIQKSHNAVATLPSSLHFASPQQTEAADYTNGNSCLFFGIRTNAVPYRPIYSTEMLVQGIWPLSILMSTLTHGHKGTVGLRCRRRRGCAKIAESMHRRC